MRRVAPVPYVGESEAPCRRQLANTWLHGCGGRARGILCSVLLVGACVVPSSLRAAIESYDVVPSATLVLGGSVYSSRSVLRQTGISLSIVAQPSIPDGITIDAYSLYPGGYLVSFDTTVTMDGVTYAHNDLARFDSGASSFIKHFDGNAQGVPEGVDLVGVHHESGVLYLVFDSTFRAPDGSVFGPHQVVSWNGSFAPETAFSLTPVPDGVGIDAIARAGGAWLVSLDIGASAVGVVINANEILECSGAGICTATFDPAAQDAGWTSVNLTAIDAVLATLTPTLTSTNTRTPTRTPSVTASITSTVTSPVTSTFSATITPTITHTPTRTPTRTATQTPTRTATYTASRTATQTSTPTVTPTQTTTPTPPSTGVSFGATPAVGRPGGLACLIATLQDGDGLPEVQNRVAFDPNLFLSFDGWLNPAIGPGTATDKSLVVTASDEGSVDFRVGGSPYPLPDGLLYTARVEILGNVGEGVYSLQGSAEGAIQVSTCNGDCDGNGEVNVKELQHCINLFLGHALCDAASGQRCPIADLSNDGVVGLGEVQKCAGTFLSGCP